MTEEKLIKIRRKEQLNAGKVLGLKDFFFLKHNDTELIADLVLKKEIVYYIRKLKPEIVITTDPTFIYSSFGFINHTDHRAAGLAAIDAIFPMARDRLTFPEHERRGLLPHKVKILYLANFEKPTEIIDISDSIDLKLKALKAHKSQISNEVIVRIKERAKQLGKKRGYSFGKVLSSLTFCLRNNASLQFTCQKKRIIYSAEQKHCYALRLRYYSVRYYSSWPCVYISFV